MPASFTITPEGIRVTVTQEHRFQSGIGDGGREGEVDFRASASTVLTEDELMELMRLRCQELLVAIAVPPEPSQEDDV